MIMFIRKIALLKDQTITAFMVCLIDILRLDERCLPFCKNERKLITHFCAKRNRKLPCGFFFCVHLTHVPIKKNEKSNLD